MAGHLYSTSIPHVACRGGPLEECRLIAGSYRTLSARTAAALPDCAGQDRAFPPHAEQTGGAGQVRFGQVRAGQARIGQISLLQKRFGQVTFCP